ncbi:MAG TPA: polysaccharide deacetylase family protein, partial [Solirubrobacterales bacterium]
MARPERKDFPGAPRDLVGYGPEPPVVEWPGGASLALSIVVNYEEGSELSYPAGDERHETVAEVPVVLPQDQRDLHVESVFEYGSRAGIWRLLRMFEEYECETTFFACAVALEENPEVGSRALEAGHELCCHGWRWEDHWPLRREEERGRIRAAVESFERLYGVRPLGWFTRFTAGLNTRELLVEEGGFRYDCDAFNDDLPYYVEVS